MRARRVQSRAPPLREELQTAQATARRRSRANRDRDREGGSQSVRVCARLSQASKPPWSTAAQRSGLAASSLHRRPRRWVPLATAPRPRSRAGAGRGGRGSASRSPDTVAASDATAPSPNAWQSWPPARRARLHPPSWRRARGRREHLLCRSRGPRRGAPAAASCSPRRTARRRSSASRHAVAWLAGGGVPCPRRSRCGKPPRLWSAAGVVHTFLPPPARREPLLLRRTRPDACAAGLPCLQLTCLIRLCWRETNK